MQVVHIACLTHIGYQLCSRMELFRAVSHSTLTPSPSSTRLEASAFCFWREHQTKIFKDSRGPVCTWLGCELHCQCSDLCHLEPKNMMFLHFFCYLLLFSISTEVSNPIHAPLLRCLNVLAFIPRVATEMVSYSSFLRMIPFLPWNKPCEIQKGLLKPRQMYGNQG